MKRSEIEVRFGLLLEFPRREGWEYTKTLSFYSNSGLAVGKGV